MEKTTNKKIIETIELLKKDNIQNFKKARKEKVMVNWDIERVKKLVDVYLDNVLVLLQLKQEVRNSSHA